MATNRIVSASGTTGGSDASGPDESFITMMQRGGHTWVFCWRLSQRSELCRRISQAAGDPDNPLTWRDAAVLHQKITEA